jgi:type IV fimbrial biogenesis protein FimT
VKNLDRSPTRELDAATGPRLVTRRVRRLARRRGFTITELMLVMAIIGILSAISFPKFYNVIRDRKVNKNALEIMNLYRLAKSRAMGRGAAVMVRYTLTSGVPLFEMRESVANNAAGAAAGAYVSGLPVSSCTGTGWPNDYVMPANGTPGSRPIATLRNLESVNASTLGLYRFNAPSALGAQTGAIVANPGPVEVCFTPRGRSYIRYQTSLNGAWFPLTSVLRIDVLNSRLAALATPGVGVTRSVYIPPSGMPRLGL